MSNYWDWDVSRVPPGESHGEEPADVRAAQDSFNESSTPVVWLPYFPNPGRSQRTVHF
jgi:hypothetical protein